LQLVAGQQKGTKTAAFCETNREIGTELAPEPLTEQLLDGGRGAVILTAE
jgi:hypothetical protein